MAKVSMSAKLVMTADEAAGMIPVLKERMQVLDDMMLSCVRAAHGALKIIDRLREVDELRGLDDLAKMRDRLQSMISNLNALERGNLVIHEVPALCDAIWTAVNA